MFDDRGPAERRNDRSGPLQRTPNRRVWVDLAVVYPRERNGWPARPAPDGVDLNTRVPGDLLEWCRTTTGEWVGWCCVQVSARGELAHVWQYVPAAALSLRDELTR